MPSDAMHSALAAGNIHIPYQWSYADETAREAASGFEAGDVGKLALQEDNNTLWILAATTPTWVAVSGAGGSLSVTKVAMQVRVPLYDNVLASDGTWDVSSLSQDYDHLELLIWGMSPRAQVSDAMKLYFNNDTTDGNYMTQIGQSADTVASATENDYSFPGNNPGTTAPANSAGITRVLILNYANATKKTQVLAESSYRTADGTLHRDMRGIQWENTAAINRITIRGNVETNLLAGSWLQIIGIGTVDVVTDVSLS